MKPLFFSIMAMTGIAALAACAGPEFSNRGLAPCPDSPNCVSSQSSDKQHAIAPLTYDGTRDAALENITAIVTALPRTAIVTEGPEYLHVTFRSKWFRFVDDVEFWLPSGEPGIIHIRSASRLGYSDLGVNRKRMEDIRKRFEEKNTPQD